VDQRLQDLFKWEIAFQCDCILRANDHLQTASNEPMPTRDVSEIWYALQGLLIAAANIQKLAWGQGGKKGPQRADLRTSLAITDNSALHNPDLRNDFEHFDERLDEWYATAPHQNYTTRGTSSFLNPFDDPSFAGFGHYDRAIGVITFEQKKHSLSVPPVVAEARRILTLIDPTRWRPPGP
jgi:hypothetical protein